MKKMAVIFMALALLAQAAVGCAEEEARMGFSVAAGILAQAGDCMDVAALLENAEADLVYTSSDEAVATVDEAGQVTAVGEGVATIVAVSAADPSVYAYMDVTVCDYLGAYTGVKHIDAMGCDIEISITLNPDGTYAYYRAPMDIAIEGGGSMEALEDQGSYEVVGSEFVFTSEALGEYSAAFSLIDAEATLSGKLPTGGPVTDMTVSKAQDEGI
ncbi:MAG: Ig-like domain-containing protein [Clostridia bacterium]|nr:Ig-like domain-containing protein [Clostridia bacterium]